MSRCETCKKEFVGDGARFCSPACHPDFGKGDPGVIQVLFQTKGLVSEP